MKIGTRGSPLALAQTREVVRMLTAAHACAEDKFEIVVIGTTGDMIQDRALAEAGGKGLFTKEIDAAMLNGDIDAAVHSSKDLPTTLPAVGQGAIAVTARTNDPATLRALGPTLDAETGHCLLAERTFLGVLDGSCRTPIAGHARIISGTLEFRGMVLRADGFEAFEVRTSGPVADAQRIGADAGRDLLTRLLAGVLA